MTRPRSSTIFINSAAPPGLPRSVGMTVISVPVAWSSAAKACIGSRRRATSTRSCPSLAASRASSAPMPLDAPVTSATGRVELAIVMNPLATNRFGDESSGDDSFWRASTAGEGGGALLDEMGHPLLEIFRTKRGEHFRVGHRPGFGKRLEIGLEDLPFDHADRARRRRGDQLACDRLDVGKKIVGRQFAN